MVWWHLAACVFIDDAEHAEFVAGLERPGGRGDTADTADTGDTGAFGGDQDVAAIGAGFTAGEAGQGLGAGLAVGEVAALGPAVFASGTGESEGGRRGWGVSLATLVPGEITPFDATAGMLTDAGGEGFGMALAVVERTDGGRRLLVGDPNDSRVDSYVPRATGTALSDGTLAGESSGDGFGSALGVAPGATNEVAIGAPNSECGAAYLGEWPLGDGEELDATVLFHGGGRKLVPGPCDEGGPARFGDAVAVGDFDGSGGLGMVIGAPGEDDHAGAAYIVDDVRAITDHDGVIYGVDLPRIAAEGPAGALGTSVAIGDVDGDGYDEAVIGAPLLENGVEGAGSVYVFSSVDPFVSAPATEAHITLRSFTRDAQFGASVAVVERAEGGWLAVGAPGWGDAEGHPGLVYVFAGAGLESEGALEGALRIHGSSNGGRLGASMAANPEVGPGVLLGEPAGDVAAESGAGLAWWISLAP